MTVVRKNRVARQNLPRRRDLLAQELETRLSGDRRASGELETRWRELDRLRAISSRMWRRWKSGCSRLRNRSRKPMRGCDTAGWN